MEMVNETKGKKPKCTKRFGFLLWFFVSFPISQNWIPFLMYASFFSSFQCNFEVFSLGEIVLTQFLATDSSFLVRLKRLYQNHRNELPHHRRTWEKGILYLKCYKHSVQWTCVWCVKQRHEEKRMVGGGIDATTMLRHCCHIIQLSK